MCTQMQKHLRWPLSGHNTLTRTVLLGAVLPSLCGADQCSVKRDELPHAAPVGPHSSQVSATLKLLARGNQRIVSGLAGRPDERSGRQVARLPTAPVIVTCSDLPAPPEDIFDSGPRELFVVQTPGHTLDAAASVSIDHAIQSLRARLIVVLGHAGCGVVQDALTLQGASNPISYRVLANVAASTSPRSAQYPEDLDLAIRANVRATVRQLKRRSAVVQGNTVVVAAIFDPRTGAVSAMDMNASNPPDEAHKNCTLMLNPFSSKTECRVQ